LITCKKCDNKNFYSTSVFFKFQKMIGPSSSISKILLTLLILLIIFYIYLDVHLYLRIQNYPIDRNFHVNGTIHLPSTQQTGPRINYSDVTLVNCHINPLCDVTVKALMLDHTNHYIFAPLAVLFDDFTGISKSNFITPNMISVFHVFVAILSGRLLAINHLGYRRKIDTSIQNQTQI
jgi:hypothetical protein